MQHYLNTNQLDTLRLQKPHPAGLPEAVGVALEKTHHPSGEIPVPSYSPNVAETVVTATALLAKIAANLAPPLLWKLAVKDARQLINHPKTVLQTINNQTSETVVAFFGDSQAAGDAIRFDLAPGEVVANLEIPFSEYFVCLGLQTVSGANASAQVTVGSSFSVGDVFTLSLTTEPSASGAGVTYSASYTVQSGDTSATIATALGNALSTASNGLVIPSANGSVITFTAALAGSAGNAYVLTPSVSGTGTLTVTRFAGAVAPALLACGRYC